MSWLIFALLTIIFYAGFDFFIKLSSDKIHAGLGGLIINFISTIVLLIFLLITKSKGENVFQTKSNGIIFSVIAGIVIGLATITFLKMFSAGTNLSIGVPLVRIGIVLIASFLGILVLKEPFTLKYLLGLIISLFGLYLLITK
ncbi:hypothetical protein A3J78_01920 [Candidatus Beckwithbacteria bacterium RBG_13_35_6]|uniref:EamA domain-containing protein n=1 Tax=Candidatus Beckwithbacteria bacterium RBG_13_35_6 TaxID=1797456 RepID=A0A1F5DG98_9BACT|nr:MAG: hypothetical protein A3J78_01920 [Candidatus Beckwithbacteria bacterium RBG_13_35_6]